MTAPDFETNKSSWKIRVTLGELVEVSKMLSCMFRSSPTTSSVWLTKVPNGPRLWIIRENNLTAWVVADGETSDPLFALPVPDSFFDHLIEVAAGNGGADLYCNEFEGSIVAQGGSSFVSTDHPRNAHFTHSDLPYLGGIQGHNEHFAIAELQVSDLGLFGEVVLDIPKNADANRLFPHVNMTIGDNRLSWTMDWRRFNGARTTGSVQARTHGDSYLTFYPYGVARLLRFRDGTDTVRVFVDAENSDHVYFASDKWGIRVLAEREELSRWGSVLREQLQETSADILTGETDREPDFLEFSLDGRSGFASIHVHEDGLSDYVRLTHIATKGTPDSAEVFREINALNETLHGARVVLREGEVRVIIEFPAKALHDLGSHVRVFRSAVDRCHETTVFLPLFSGSNCAS